MFFCLANLKCEIKQRRLLCRSFFLFGKNNQVSFATAEIIFQALQHRKQVFMAAPLAQKQSKGNLSFFVRMARRSNNASPEELTKVLSLLQKKPPQSTFYSMSTEGQIAEKEDLLTEMILLSARPTSSWVSTALRMVWQRSERENIGRFAEALTFCSQYCFQKAFQSTTGAKLSPSVKRIASTILRSSTRPLSTGDKIRRSLKRVS